MFRVVLSMGVSAVLAAGLIAAPASAVSAPETQLAKSDQVSARNYSDQELSVRGSDRRINAKRTGAGSVQGIAEIKSELRKQSPNKRVRIVTAHSTNGSISGFDGVKVRTIQAKDVDSVINSAEADETAVAVDIDRPVNALGTSAQSYPGGGEYSQWALNKLEAEQVWGIATGAGVKVAVLDTGVEGGHPDLNGRLLSGKNFVDDGYTELDDPEGHGTHVAGIVAASMNNFGVTGLAPGSKIIPIRVLDDEGSGYLSDVVDGIYEAADRGADVINMSLGGAGTASPTMELAVAYARNKGSAVVAAMGNNGGYVSMIPAVLPGVVGVASTTNSDARSSFSNYNLNTDISAPGSNIMSTYHDSAYVAMSGTSMATPYAAAAMAVTLQAARKVNPKATGVGVEQVVTSTASDLGSSGWDQYFGNGRVNPLAAVQAAANVQPVSQVKKKIKKVTRQAVKVTVKVSRSRAKLRRVSIRGKNATTVKIKLAKSVRGKWRTQRTLSLHKSKTINLRLAVGRYRLTRNATVTYYKLNRQFRVR